jgi:selenocysteine-specific elongation factor
VVLRDSGRDETVGGGRVLDPFPPAGVHGTTGRVRRAEELEAREAGGRSGLLQRVLAERGVAPLAELPGLIGTGPAGLAGPLREATGSGRAVRSRTLAWSAPAWSSARAAVLEAVEAHHRAEPLAPGLPTQTARQAALAGQPGGAPGPPRAAGDAGRGARPDGWPAAAGAEVVEALLADGTVVADGPAVRLPDHGVQLDPAQQAVRARVEQTVDAGAITVLGDAALGELGADRRMTAVLVRLGVLVAIAPGTYVGRTALERAVRDLRRAFAADRTFAATEAKEVLGTTRKTAIPLLEHLDRSGVTVRLGDLRRLTPVPGADAPP